MCGLLFYNKTMNILLTNDDGYNAPGILLLKELLAKYGEVTIVAPKNHMSAKSCSITIGVPLVITEEDKDIYSFTGTPADCVSFALTSMDKTFDLVVSGCNAGWNVSYDTIYSGTIGACLEALLLRVPSIAFSSENGLEVVKDSFDKVMDYILTNNLISKDYLLNVNFPNSEVKGISLSTEYYRKDTNYFTRVENGYLPYRHVQNDFSDQKDSDCYHVTHGIISIVPLNRTYYSKDLFDKVKEKMED